MSQAPRNFLLRHPDFGLFWAGMFAVNIAVQIEAVTIGWQIYSIGRETMSIKESAFLVGMVGLVFGTTAGLLVARIGPRRAILAALVLGAAVSLVQSVFPPYPVMMLTRVLEGVSHLAIVVVGPTAIAGVTSARHQGLAMTLWSSFFGLSYAGLAVIGPRLVEWQGVKALFLAQAGFLLAVAALLALLLPRLAPAALPPLTLGGVLRQHGTIYRSPRIAAPATGFFFYTLLYVALLTLLPLLLLLLQKLLRSNSWQSKKNPALRGFFSS